MNEWLNNLVDESSHSLPMYLTLFQLFFFKLRFVDNTVFYQFQVYNHSGSQFPKVVFQTIGSSPCVVWYILVACLFYACSLYLLISYPCHVPSPFPRPTGSHEFILWICSLFLFCGIHQFIEKLTSDSRDNHGRDTCGPLFTL